MNKLKLFLVAAFISLIALPTQGIAQRRQVSYTSQRAGQHATLQGVTGNATVEQVVDNGTTQHQVTWFATTSGVSAVTVTVSAKTVAGNYAQISSSSSLSGTILFTGTYGYVKVVYTGFTGTGVIDADYFGNVATPTIIAASDGTALSAVTDPCDGVLATTVAISQTTSTKLISASAGKKNYICGGTIIAAAAEVVNFIEGTGSTCGSSTAALVGSTTAANGMSLAANGGFVITKTISGFTAASDTCLSQNATSRVSGWITYVQL